MDAYLYVKENNYFTYMLYAKEGDKNKNALIKAKKNEIWRCLITWTMTQAMIETNMSQILKTMYLFILVTELCVVWL